MRSKPSKPTEPFGGIRFPKRGSVTLELFTLSSDKASQESEAFNRFVNCFNEIDANWQISVVTQLPEDDHDFSIRICDQLVHVQLSELVDREYVRPFVGGVEWAGGIRIRGSQRLVYDSIAERDALRKVIQKKIDKCYARSSGIATWLVVFCVSSYRTEYIMSGELRRSPGLCAAQDALQVAQQIDFDEIWFTDLLTQPVQVWPVPNEPHTRDA